ncbi:hypothetical protein P7C70_g3799, partial [Phenoliferia sp. Uapishka_3]
MTSKESNEAVPTSDSQTEQSVTPPKSPSPPPPAPKEEVAVTNVAPPAPSTPQPSAAALQLQALFPDTPIDIIETVLQHEGTVEAATETLLAMGDPSFNVTASQMDSDAQMARMLEDEDRAEARRTRSSQSATSNDSGGTGAPGGPLAYKPYVPRRARPTSGGMPAGAPSSPAAGGKDELDQLAEGFSKLAEQGKKTLGSFFNKVKEQINSLDAPGGSSTTAEGAQQSQGWTPPSALPRPQPHTQRSQPAPVPDLIPPPPPAPAPSSPAASSPAVESSTTTAEKQPTPPLDPKKDFSKIGLLPRQSISLLDSNKDKGAAHDDSDDDEDLEYVRSPFDDD